MIGRVKEILDILEDKTIVLKRELKTQFTNTEKTQKAINYVIDKRYAHSFGSILMKSKVDRSNLEGINPIYHSVEKHIEDKLAVIKPNIKSALNREVSIIEWCYVLYRDGYRIITSQYLSEVSERNPLYVQNQLNKLDECGYIEKQGTHSSKFKLKWFIPSFGSEELQRKALSSLNFKKRKVEEKEARERQVEEAVIDPSKGITMEDKVRKAKRFVGWMKPETEEEYWWMLGNFIAAIEWGLKKH